MEAECNNVEIETPEDELSKLTHKLEHEMDELAKLEEEVEKEQERLSSYEIMTDQTESTSEDIKVEMSEDTLKVSHKSDSRYCLS